MYQKKYRRSAYEIVAEMLEILAEEPRLKTHLMTGANITHQLLQRYLRFVIKNGLARKEKRVYYITDKGKEYLREYNRGIIFNQDHSPLHGD